MSLHLPIKLFIAAITLCLNLIPATSVARPVSPARTSKSASAATFLSHLTASGIHPLICDVPNSDPDHFVLSASANSVFVQAKENSRGAVYSVTGAKINSGNLIIAMSNDVDGPLQTNVLIIKGMALISLARGQTAQVNGIEVTREGYDGTTSRTDIVCHY